ncbi:uncharacterized protein ASPGLDRAFT_49533 [Aspergillus glaucus CBS 516.65]|uniref:Uncharacterized protein n=1 Tax=Aspergillus glaucus CBS 516.65 TaxID=1160497 RepID=A0A1L9VE02_ASPGL|nr:hypothetical protein ASPGLDRAFT_49533 [Aspergillus glaucus CBS 516.65]OJJ82123.1 hypothetical protein ASPGLDRAFT_49533 [Aspergillus glaucus CBS 516.65]
MLAGRCDTVGETVALGVPSVRVRGSGPDVQPGHHVRKIDETHGVRQHEHKRVYS